MLIKYSKIKFYYYKGEKNERKIYRMVLGIIFAIVGAGIIMGGIFSIISVSKFRETAVETTAQV